MRQVYHYKNTPMQYTENFSAVKKNENFIGKCLIFLIFLPQCGGSNEYPHSMFWDVNKKSVV